MGYSHTEIASISLSLEHLSLSWVNLVTKNPEDCLESILRAVNYLMKISGARTRGQVVTDVTVLGGQGGDISIPGTYREPDFRG